MKCIRALACLLLLTVATSVVPVGAFAKKKQPTYEVPYGMAGCGLWTYVIKGKDQGSQLGMWVLKSFIFPDFQTSGITSGTSNCVHNAPNYARAEQQVYMQVNLASVAKDASQGSGDYLHALAEVFGCQDHTAFAKFSQEHYDKIFNDSDPNLVLDSYLNEIKSEKRLADSCIRIT